VPTLPPGVTSFFIPVRGSRKSRTVVYRPWLLGAGRVQFVNVKLDVDKLTNIAAVTPITDSPIPVDWTQGSMIDIALDDLEKSGEPDAQYGTLPAAASQSKRYTAWKKDFSTWLYRTQRLEMMSSPSLKETSEPGEAERDFRLRMQQLAREERDDAVDALRKKYASKIRTLQERIRKAEQAVEREEAQARQAGLQTAVNVGATLLGALVGRKIASASTVGKAATTAKSLGRASQQREDIARAEETVEALQKQLADLEAEFDAETAKIAASIDPMTEELTPVIVKPRKADISVQLVTLVWAPHWRDEVEGLIPAW
jgi:phage host-nuclease inhibitor protein Gam